MLAFSNIFGSNTSSSGMRPERSIVGVRSLLIALDIDRVFLCLIAAFFFKVLYVDFITEI